MGIDKFDDKPSRSLPYPKSTLSAPISPVEVEKWKATVSPTFQHYFKKKYNDLQKKYEQLVEEYYVNKIMYEAELNFEPIIGKTYYLYERANGTFFISMVGDGSLGPHLTYHGKFVLTSQQSWKRG